MISSPMGIEPLGTSDRMLFSSTSFAGDGVALLFMDEFVPAGVLSLVSADGVEAMCAECVCAWDRKLCIVAVRRGERGNGEAAAGHGHGVRTELASMTNG